MRFWFACLLSVCLWPATGYSQPGVGISVSGTIPRHPIPIPPVGGGYGPQPYYGSHSHYGYGGHRGYGYGVYGGYGYDPTIGFSFSNGSPFGFNYSGFYGGPGIGVGYSVPLYGPTYYGPAWGPYNGWSTPIAPVYVNTAPTNTLPALPQWMIDEANLNPSSTLKSKPISQTHRSLVQPSTPEAQLRSVRMQAAGDRLLIRLDYAAAEKSYAKALQAAPDRPDPYVRLAITKVGKGDLRGAVAYLRQMTDVDPTYPARSDSLDTLFGHQNGIAKLQVKQRAADWTKQDIHDTDRIFLLGAMLYFDRDERFRTLLDTAVKLDGDLPHYRAFLDAAPAADPAAVAPTPDEIDALTAPLEKPAPGTPPPPQAAPDTVPLTIPSKTKPPTPPAPLLLPPVLPKVPTP